MKNVKEIIGEEGQRKILIYLRDAGTYGFELFVFDKTENIWRPQGGRRSHGIFASAEDAEREALSRCE